MIVKLRISLNGEPQQVEQTMDKIRQVWTSARIGGTWDKEVIKK